MNYSTHEAIRYQYLANEAAAFARFYREQMKHSQWRYGEYHTAATVYQDRSAALHRLARHHATADVGLSGRDARERPELLVGVRQYRGEHRPVQIT